MKGYVKNCLIGKIEFHPKNKYGVLYTSDKWKGILDSVWKFLGSESKIPVDTSENERYFIIYSSIRDFAIRASFVIGLVAVYLFAMRGCVV